MKILFPTAFSLHAKQYFQFALELAHSFNAELILMHTFSKSEYRTTVTDDLKKRGRAAINDLKEFVAKNKSEHHDVHISYHVKEGGPVSAIKTAASEKGVDLIVMGMKATTGKGKSHIGAVAQEIMESGPCPVLVVPPTAKLTIIDRLVYAMAFEFKDLAAINELLRWCEVLKAQLSCVHVWEKGDKGATSIMRNVEVLKELYDHRNPGIKIEIIRGEVVKELSEFTKENEVDILVLSSHNRTFFEKLFLTNTTIEVAKIVDTPILILRDN